MARSSPNNYKSDLISGWSNREEFVQCLLTDQKIIDCISRYIGSSLHKSRDEQYLTLDTLNQSTLTRAMFNSNSWRLKHTGLIILDNAYTCYKVSHPNNWKVTGRILTNIGRSINGPWYLSSDAVYVWDQHKHFELAMFDGDLGLYINFNMPK